MLRLWHEINSIPWSVWVATVALLVGLGAFLDEYYVQEPARERARALLIALLLRLENPRKHIKSMADLLLEIGSNMVLSGVLLLAAYPLEWLPRAGWFHNSLGFIATLILGFSVAIGAASIINCVLLSPLLVAVLTYYALKALLSVTFKPACEPKRSPFKFVTGLIGIWVLSAKLILELTK